MLNNEVIRLVATIYFLQQVEATGGNIEEFSKSWKSLEDEVNN
mgnify:CR=1 FL=1